jgi:hypothetical protein
MSIAGGITMMRLALLAAAVALAASVTATSALAKGASEATITGPGLGGGLTLAGEGQPGGERLMELAETAGFFPAVFVTSPNPMLSARPRGKLGPRHTITYTMPGPNGALDELRQELYPFATPDPMTYMEPGQSYFGTEETVGGWYVAGTMLKDDLIALGVPENPPLAGDGGSDILWRTVGIGAVLGGVLVLACTALVLRRRQGPATV